MIKHLSRTTLPTLPPLIRRLVLLLPVISFTGCHNSFLRHQRRPLPSRLPYSVQVAALRFLPEAFPLPCLLLRLMLKPPNLRFLPGPEPLISPCMALPLQLPLLPTPTLPSRRKSLPSVLLPKTNVRNETPASPTYPLASLTWTTESLSSTDVYRILTTNVLPYQKNVTPFDAPTQRPPPKVLS